MKCDEVQNCLGPYLDSELDAKTSLEIQQHLNDCPECRDLFSQEQQLERWIKAGLNRGQKSDLVWQQLEEAVIGVQANRTGLPKAVETPTSRQSPMRTFWLWLDAGWASSRLVWAGLAATWLAILVLNLDSTEGRSSPPHKQQALSAFDMSFAIHQQKVLLAELTSPSEPSEAKQPKPPPTGPRSDGRSNSSNS